MPELIRLQSPLALEFVQFLSKIHSATLEDRLRGVAVLTNSKISLQSSENQGIHGPSIKFGVITSSGVELESNFHLCNKPCQAIKGAKLSR